MKKLENMTIEEIIEFDKKQPVLSRIQFEINKKQNILTYLFLPNILSLSININNLIIYPSIINLYAFSISGIATAFSIKPITNSLKYKKNLIKSETYEEYREKLPIRTEIERLYNKLLDDLIKEIDESKIDKDPLSIAILVGDYLIPSGLLSYTKKFHIITKTWEDISFIDCSFYPYPSTKEGLYVTAGYGCCRHINSLISDLFTKKGIISDKLVAITDTKEDIELKINQFNFDNNHVVVGYIYENKYHIIDGFNNSYSIIKDKDYYYYQEIPGKVIIPDLSNTVFSNEINYSPDIEYSFFDIKEVEEKEKKIGNLLIEGELKRFIDFKINHFELLERLAYLIPLELERTKEKEKQKVKRKRI